MKKEIKEKIIKSLENPTKYTIYSEEDFAGGFEIEAESLEEAEEKVIDLIDIHESKTLQENN